DYLVERPSRHPSLRHVGQALPAFLDAERRRSFGGSTVRPPWLADLARLESARLEVFDAADAPSLTVGQVRTLGDRLAELPLQLIPAHVHLWLAWPVDEIWEALDAERSWEALDAELSWNAPLAMRRPLLVWRKEGVVFHRPFLTHECNALAQLTEGRATT